MSINKMFLRETDECRICMGTKTNKVSLFQNNLSLKITILADVEVTEGDGLPSTICADCETDLEKFYEFRAQVQLADKKFREDLCLSQIDIEDCNIKQEQCEGSTEERSDSSNSHHYSVDNKTNIVKETDQQDDDDHIAEPIKHVEITDNTEREANVMTDDPLGQDEPLIEAYIMNLDNEPNQDPLTSTKEEPVPMDSNGHTAETSIPPSSVRGIVPAIPFPISPDITKKCKEKFEMGSLKQKQTNYFVVSSIFSPQTVSFINQTTTNNPGLILTSNARATNFNFTNVTNITSNKHNTNSNVTAIPNLLTTNNKITGSSSIQEVTSVMKQTSDQVLFSKNGYLVQVKPNVLISTNVMPLQDFETRKTNSKPITISRKVITAATGTCVTQGTSHLSNAAISGHLENESKNNETSKLSNFCSICNMSFITTELLNEHKEEKEFFCRICTLGFHSHTDLEMHFVSHTPYTCRKCKKSFFCKKDLFTHKINSSSCNVKTECEVCNKPFHTKTSLAVHKKKFHFSRISCKCVVCEKMLTDSQDWKRHVSSVHVAYEFMECKFCHNLLLGPEKLKNHIKYVHLDTDQSCPFVCSTCGKVFRRRTLLKTHQYTHDVTTILCEICGKPIKGKFPMANHIRREHRDKKGTFLCKLCKKSFDTQRKLNEHLKSSTKHNTSSKVFYCEVCGKSFKRLRNLLNHQRSHTDDKPFKCELCGATFNNKYTLMTHGRVHNSVGKYRCNECGMTFRWKQTFDKHVKNCENVDDIDINNSTEPLE